MEKTVWYEAAKWTVIAGIFMELLGDAGVFKAGDRVQEILDKQIVELETPRTLSEAKKND